MIDLGTVKPGSTLRIPFNTFDKDDGSSITMTAFAVGDILVYKDGSTTERASTSGYTATTDFDSKTGKQLAIIDLADNTTAGFFSAGSEYIVAIDAVTVDAVTTGGWIARFRIGYVGAVLDTTISVLGASSNQSVFNLTNGPPEDDVLNGMWAIIHDVAHAYQCAYVIIQDYQAATKTVILAANPAFGIAATDNFSVMGPAPLQPTTEKLKSVGRALDVSAGGEAGVDWANVGSPTTTVNLSGTSTKAVEPTVAGRTLDISAGGEAGVDWANVGSQTTTVGLTNTTIATTQKVDVETIKTNPVVNAGTITFPTTATLASTTNITAGTITTATNVTTVNGLAANVITAAATAADFGAEIADAIWDEDIVAAHGTADTAGRCIRTLDAISDRTNNANLNALLGVTDAAGADIYTDIIADTDDIQSRLPAALVSGRMDASVGAMAANVLTATAIAADAITAAKIADGAIDAATFAAGAIDATAMNVTGSEFTAIPWNAAWDAEVQSEVQDALDGTLADSVPADGTRPSISQALYMIAQFLLERSVSGTTVTVNKVDGTTALMTLTLDSATSPTSITRAT